MGRSTGGREGARNRRHCLRRQTQAGDRTVVVRAIEGITNLTKRYFLFGIFAWVFDSFVKTPLIMSGDNSKTNFNNSL